MFPVETRGAAARRQSDRPPCIDDDSAQAPPWHRHPTTSGRRIPLLQILSLAAAGGLVVATLRGDRFEASAPTTTRSSAVGVSATRPTASTDEPFNAYLVSSFEEAQLLRKILGGDRSAVHVIASEAEEASVREQLRAVNAVRTQRGLDEIAIVDLRTAR